MLKADRPGLGQQGGQQETLGPVPLGRTTTPQYPALQSRPSGRRNRRTRFLLPCECLRYTWCPPNRGRRRQHVRPCALGHEPTPSTPSSQPGSRAAQLPVWPAHGEAATSMTRGAHTWGTWPYMQQPHLPRRVALKLRGGSPPNRNLRRPPAYDVVPASFARLSFLRMCGPAVSAGRWCRCWSASRAPSVERGCARTVGRLTVGESDDREGETGAEPKPIRFGNNPRKEGGSTYDDLPPAIAVRLARTRAGAMPRLLPIRQDAVREIMPDLARALDRLSET